jgi:hypothetical protein
MNHFRLRHYSMRHFSMWHFRGSVIVIVTVKSILRLASAIVRIIALKSRI